MKLRLIAAALGCFALLTGHLRAETFYVNASNPFPSPPYTNWATAATNIQDAVAAATSSGDTILVTNGVYQFGGLGGNFNASRVNVTQSGLTVRSVNGPAVTVIKGFQLPGSTNGLGAVRGVFLASGSTLSGFTVTGGATASANYPGGGIYCTSPSALVTNCIITGNASASFGGGVYQGTLNNCFISQNVATGDGGGTWQSQLNNCLVLTNSASYGGGASGGSLTNCVVVGNLARSSPSGGGVYNAALYNSVIYYNNTLVANSSGTNVFNSTNIRNCCTTPIPVSGSDNITNVPGFVDLAGGNYRLQAGSLCIDAGTNTYVTATTDLDGNPRIAGAAVDIGAYENQNTNLIHYVSLSSTNPVPPFTNWLTAATNIQDAIGVAQPGEIVAANSGAYNLGGVVMFGAETNRVVVTNGITLLSVYGPASTMIVGGTQMRCAYIGSNSLITGFTITNGHNKYLGSSDLTNEESGGGIWCEPGGMVANCLVVSNYANYGSTPSIGHGGGIYGGIISNCTIMGNVAGFGGGAGGGAVLWNCTLARNVSGGGGGAYLSALYNCTVSNNTVPYNGFSGGGGGASQCLASNCLFIGNSDQNMSRGGGTYLGTNFNSTISGNWAGNGGGVYQSSNYDCFISQNTANSYGGGAYQATLYNCVLTGNQTTNASASLGGAGAFQSMLVNCTVANNTSASTGGGVYGGTAYDSIIYFNSAAGGGANWTNTPQFSYCCTTPLNGQGSITNEPLFVDAAGGDYRLKCGSPCIDAGIVYTVPAAPFATPTNDIRGIPRPLDGNGDSIAKIDLGAYEYNQATENAPGIRALSPYTTFATSYTVSFLAQLSGCADYHWWDFGDGTTVTNQSIVSHAWSTPGVFKIILSASYSGQVVSATTTVQVLARPVYYVNQNNPNAIAPYTNWGIAATTIQAAVNAGSLPGRLVLVTNGTYISAGTILTGSTRNSVVLTNTVKLQSVNGPEVTIISPTTLPGRCCYVGSNAVLSGFTVHGGITSSTGDATNDMSGGGVWCEPGGVVSNCFIFDNRSYNSGAGAFHGTFYSCIFSNNQIGISGSAAFGAGAYQAVLYDSTVISNKISTSFPGGKGGGTYGGTLYNCRITGNSVNNGDLAGTGGGAFLGSLYNCSLTGNYGSGYGGASCSNTLWNCTVSGNSANYGGGAYASTFYNCLVTGNSAINQGGGAYLGTFYDCTVASNAAPTGAGVYSTLRTYNSIIYDNANSASNVDNWAGGGGVSGSNNCIYPQFLPLSNGNITNTPAFMNPAVGDFHLLPNSPCINAGTNIYVFTATDLDGNPRIMGGTVDIGAYEFQAEVAGSFASWLRQFGLPTDGSADYADSDGTGMVNWQKWIAGLNPTNPASVLAMSSPLLSTNGSAGGVTISWQSVGTRNYYLQRGSDLSAQPIFTTIQSNIPGQDGTTSYTDSTATNGVTYFYRVGVQ